MYCWQVLKNVSSDLTYFAKSKKSPVHLHENSALWFDYRNSSSALYTMLNFVEWYLQLCTCASFLCDIFYLTSLLSRYRQWPLDEDHMYYFFTMQLVWWHRCKITCLSGSDSQSGMVGLKRMTLICKGGWPLICQLLWNFAKIPQNFAFCVFNEHITLCIYWSVIVSHGSNY